MLDYIDAVGLAPQLRENVISLCESNGGKILSLAEKYAHGNNKCLVNQDDLTRLAVVIEALKYTKDKYNALGIDEKIFDDTVSDINIWCMNNGGRGLKNYSWLSNHISARLFKIGRLQYQLYECNNITLDYRRLPFKKGDRLIYVHIPQGDRLGYEACVGSLADADDFFSRFFPDYEYDYYFCESWLLFEGNKSFMKPDSNILKFAGLFNIAYSVRDDSQAVERIFGKRKIFKSDYPEKTSLQRSAKHYIMNGGRLGSGIGYIRRGSVSPNVL